MPSTNGHGPKRAILYARVSTDEQARTSYSLAQQIEALREYAAREGYEVLEEVKDPGQSGASLERPGMDRVRDLVAAGGVSVVLAQDRDRFAREPAYHYLLRREFEEYGTTLRAFNDRGDESPEGELTDSILDQLAKFERAKVAERTRRGKLRRAREGKILPNQRPNYGFEFNAKRDNYVVHEEEMAILRRIFRMVGAEGYAIHAVKKVFDREGVPTPNGARYWGKTFIRRIVDDDVYKPHTFEEVKLLVSSEVASRLDPERRYGIWWFNRRRVEHKQVAETSHDGQRRYRRRAKTTTKPREEWIAVPVPDSGVPRELVEAARETTKDNKKCSAAGRRIWELSGGILRCAGCGRTMTTLSLVGKGYHYYRCPTRQTHGRDACPDARHLRAERAEEEVWKFVSGILKAPVSLEEGLEEMIERERNGTRGAPEKEAATWLGRISEVEKQRSRAQDLAIEGLLTPEELRERLRHLEEVRRTAEEKLAALRECEERLQALERDRDALLKSYAKLVPEALDTLEAEERHRVYKMLRLSTLAHPDGTLEVSGAIGEDVTVCINDSAS
jgi:site-specific DNA recombinase